MLLLLVPTCAAFIGRSVPVGPVLRAPAPLLNLLEPSELQPPPEKVVAAVEALPSQQRVTAADLSAQSGIGIDDARLGLKELATALAGADGLSVSASSKGDLLYTFPADVRKELAARSNAAKVRDAWNSAKPVLQTVGRVSFGLALFVSIAVIFTAITVLQSSSDDERRDDRRDPGFGGGGFGGGGFGGGFGFGYGFSPLDLIFPPWPYGYYSYGWWAPPPRMSLPEAIFSFVFGDGDPNTALRAARLRAMAETIRANGGAVVAESLAPYLDPPPLSKSADSTYLVDESWVLPAVTELGGRPEVADDGTICYCFDDLTVSAMATQANLILADPGLAAVPTLGAAQLAELAAERGIPTRGSDAPALREALSEWADDQISSQSASGQSDLFPQGYLEERQVPFSNAEGGQLFAAGALGLINFGGAAYLGSLLADLQSQLPPGMGRLPEELGALQDLYPFLLAYAVAYVAVPAVRFLQLQRTNAEIDERNANRRAWRDQLRQGGDALKKRLQAAAQRKKTLRLVTEEEVSFDSSKDLAEQREEQTPGLDDFDRRLREASGGKGK